MAQNLQIDPTKRDYVLVQGSPVPSDRVEEACYFALTIPLDNWLYGQANQGSELYKFIGAKRTRNTEQLFAARARVAIETQVIATGKAQAVAIRNIDSSRNGTSNQIEVIPAESQLADQLSFVPI